MSKFVGPRIITNNLILCLDAANIKSYPQNGADWFDISKNSNASLINSPIYSNQNSGEIIFNGINNYGTLNNMLSNLSDNNSLTISIFVNINEPTLSTKSGILCNQKGQTETDPGGFGMVIDSDGTIGVTLTKEISGIKTTYENLGSFPIEREKYTQYSFTYDSSINSISTYKNDILQNTVSDSNYGWTKNTSNRNTEIGKNTQTGWLNYYKMNISNILIYNRALSNSEIRTNFNSFQSRYHL